MLKRLLRAFPICLIVLVFSSCATSTQISASDKIVNDRNIDNDTASQGTINGSSDQTHMVIWYAG